MDIDYQLLPSYECHLNVVIKPGFRTNTHLGLMCPEQESILTEYQYINRLECQLGGKNKVRLLNYKFLSNIFSKKQSSAMYSDSEYAVKRFFRVRLEAREDFLRRQILFIILINILPPLDDRHKKDCDKPVFLID